MTSEEIILKNEHLIINETLQLLRDIQRNIIQIKLLIQMIGK